MRQFFVVPYKLLCRIAYCVLRIKKTPAITLIPYSRNTQYAIRNTFITKFVPLLLGVLFGLVLLVACAPAQPVISGDGVVRAVLFWTPGCVSCEKALRDTLPPLEAKYGGRFQLTRVPLNDLDEIGRLYEAADFFKLKKDDILVPLVVIGTDVLSGEAALARDLDGKIQVGIAAGGWAQPALPPRLLELAARATPTPRATLPALFNPAGPSSDPGACVINTPCPTVSK
jgi:hypothetical protein